MVSRTVCFCDREHDTEDVVATEHVTFAIDGGEELVMDLCPEHHEQWVEFERQQQVWADTGRPKSGPAAVPLSAAAGRRARVEEDPAVIRAWAQAEGMAVSTRGRISADVRQAYRRALEREASDRWSNSAGDRAPRPRPRKAAPRIGAPVG